MHVTFTKQEIHFIIDECAKKAADIIYERLLDKLDEKVVVVEEWISAEEAKRLLNIKSKTKLQNLRDRGEIVFSQYGRTILYSRQSILDFHKKNSRR